MSAPARCKGNTYRISSPKLGLWPEGTCPEGYHGHELPVGNRACCRTCGKNGNQPYPACLPDSGTGSAVVCPGADMTRWSNEGNEEPFPAFISAVGVCVKPDGTPYVQPGCSQPTSCAYRSRGIADPYPADNPPLAYYPCAPSAEEATCVRDLFACDEKTGACVATASGGSPLADCTRQCADKALYKCDPEAGQCKATTDGTGTSLARCQESDPACSPDGTLFECSPDLGCRASPTGTLTAAQCKDQCKSWRCMTNRCGFSTDSSLKVYDTAQLCADACGYVPPPPPAADALTIVLAVVGGLLVVGLAGMAYALRRKRAKSADGGARSGLGATWA